MTDNKSVGNQGQQAFNVYKKRIFDIKNEMAQFALDFARQPQVEIQKIEQEEQEKIKAANNAAAAAAAQEQGYMAKLFWGTVSPVANAFGAAAGVLGNAVEAGKAAIGWQAQNSLENNMKEIQEGLLKMNGILKDPKNSSYAAQHPTMEKVLLKMKAMADQLSQAKEDLSIYLGELSSPGTAYSYVTNAQDMISDIVKGVCGMKSWTEAVQITKQSTYEPSEAFKACKKKYEK